MERTISVEEKIRRAQEIYARRQGEQVKPITTLNVNENHKDIKLLKKMIIQIIICVLIYGCVSIIQNSDVIFSKEILEKANHILTYDTNFSELYQTVKNSVLSWNDQLQNVMKPQEKPEETEKQEETQNQVSEGIGGADEQAIPQQVAETQETEKQEKTQEEQEIECIKNTTSFSKPIEGIISSKYGQREPTTSTVPKNHTGTDIAANMGTKIKAATDGEVVLASEQGDYGKHLKIQIGEVSIIYAHCNNLYVKQGDKISQGQEIAEVGSTGNSTGPHLHFEIRYQEKTIDPEKILQLN